MKSKINDAASNINILLCSGIGKYFASNTLCIK